MDKYGATTPLLNGLAVSKMHQSLFEEAEAALQQAMSKNPGDADTLANLISASHHLRRSDEVIDRLIR